MEQITRIGFLGFGNLAQHLYTGFQAFCLDKQITICYTNTSGPKSQFDQATYLPLPDLLATCDVIILAIKPQQLPAVASQLKAANLADTCIVSLLAGVELSTLQSILPQCDHILRVMPNVAAEVNQSATVYSKLASCSYHFETFLTDCFRTTGLFIPIAESQMAVCTAMFGSGPAFFYQLLDHCEQFLTKNNLTQQQSRHLLIQLLKGVAASLEKRSTTQLDTLINEVTSPNGTTQAGLTTFTQANLGQLWTTVLQAAANRSEELSKEIKLD